MSKSLALPNNSLKVSSGFAKAGLVRLEIKLPLKAEKGIFLKHV
jgi:hypothetical protein